MFVCIVQEDDERNTSPAEDLINEGVERKRSVKPEDKGRVMRNEVAEQRFFDQDVGDNSHLPSSHDDTYHERQRKRRKTDEAAARLEHSSKAVVQVCFDGVVRKKQHASSITFACNP